MIFLLLAGPLRAQAEDLPPEVQPFLDDSGATPEDAAAWQLTDLLDWLADTATKDLQKPLRFALQAGGYLLLAGVLGFWRAARAGGAAWTLWRCWGSGY